jgi:DNA polymerase-3 subunit epsilon
MSARDFVTQYERCFESTWADDAPASEIRFVVLDCETTGLDPKKDRLISIGAVVVRDGEILLEDSFEALIKIQFNTASVTVHGITREETREALEEEDAVRAFIEYLRDGVIVGHHIGHDYQTIDVACRRDFDFELRNRSIDTMDLALLLERDGAFADGPRFKGFSLDALCDFFGVKPHDRHTASGDAFITAQILLRLLKKADRVNRNTLAGLMERVQAD